MYRMNEIIGPIYYLFATDPDIEWRGTLYPLKISVNHLKIDFYNFLYTEYAESDTFFCFTGLMSEIRDVFIKTLDESEVGSFQLNCFNGSTLNELFL